MPAVLVMVGVYIISSVIARLFVALGIGIFTYYGLYALIESLLGQLQSLFSGMPSHVFQLVSLAGFPEALSIICSALLTRAAVVAVQTFFGIKP
jgi:hypothetical protein